METSERPNLVQQCVEIVNIPGAGHLTEGQRDVLIYDLLQELRLLRQEMSVLKVELKAQQDAFTKVSTSVSEVVQKVEGTASAVTVIGQKVGDAVSAVVGLEKKVDLVTSAVKNSADETLEGLKKIDEKLPQQPPEAVGAEIGPSGTEVLETGMWKYVTSNVMMIASFFALLIAAFIWAMVDPLTVSVFLVFVAISGDLWVRQRWKKGSKNTRKYLIVAWETSCWVLLLFSLLLYFHKLSRIGADPCVTLCPSE